MVQINLTGHKKGSTKTQINTKEKDQASTSVASVVQRVIDMHSAPDMVCAKHGIWQLVRHRVSDKDKGKCVDVGKGQGRGGAHKWQRTLGTTSARQSGQSGTCSVGTIHGTEDDTTPTMAGGLKWLRRRRYCHNQERLPTPSPSVRSCPSPLIPPFADRIKQEHPPKLNVKKEEIVQILGMITTRRSSRSQMK